MTLKSKRTVWFHLKGKHGVGVTFSTPMSQLGYILKNSSSPKMQTGKEDLSGSFNA